MGHVLPCTLPTPFFFPAPPDPPFGSVWPVPACLPCLPACPPARLPALACLQETLPNVLALQMLLGLVYPIPSAALGFLWSAGRIVYGLGEWVGGRRWGQGRVRCHASGVVCLGGCR